jgi:hypothetical protein
MVHSIAGQWMHESFWWLKKVPTIESLISNVSWVLALLLERQQKLRMQIVYNCLPQVFGKIIICSYQKAEIELQNPNLRVLSAIEEVGIEIIDNF